MAVKCYLKPPFVCHRRSNRVYETVREVHTLSVLSCSEYRYTKYSALFNTQSRRKALLFCTKEYAPSDISSALWNIAIWINWNWLFDILFSKVTACRPQQGLRFVWTNGLLSPAAATLLAWKHLRRSGSFLSGVEGMRLTCFAFLAARYSIFRYPL